MNPFALPMAVVILPILFHYWRRSKSLLFIFTTSSLLALFVAPHIALRISDNINSRQSNNHSEVEKVKQPLIEESVQTTAEKPAQIIDHQATLLYPTQTITLSDRPSALISNPQEKKLIYANHNGEIKVIDPNTGNVIKLFKALYPTVTALSLSNDGRILAASSYDPSSIDGMNPGKGGIDVWNQTTGQSILSRSLEAETMSVALTPDGQTLASSSANGLRLWNIKTGELIHTFPEVSPGTFITISKDGQLLISGGFNGEVRIWNLSSYSLKSNISVNSSAKPPRSAIHSMAEADKILAVEAVTTIKLYKLETGESLSVFPKSIHIPSSIAFSPDGRTLAIGEDHLIRLWDIETGKQIGVLKYLKNDFFSISGLSYLDESTLVSSSEASLTNTLLSGTIEIWKIDDLSRQK
jgi:outer membrane protein assembly factor BamB